MIIIIFNVEEYPPVDFSVKCSQINPFLNPIFFAFEVHATSLTGEPTTTRNYGPRDVR